MVAHYSPMGPYLFVQLRMFLLDSDTSMYSAFFHQITRYRRLVPFWNGFKCGLPKDGESYTHDVLFTRRSFKLQAHSSVHWFLSIRKEKQKNGCDGKVVSRVVETCALLRVRPRICEGGVSRRPGNGGAFFRCQGCQLANPKQKVGRYDFPMDKPQRWTDESRPYLGDPRPGPVRSHPGSVSRSSGCADRKTSRGKGGSFSHDPPNSNRSRPRKANRSMGGTARWIPLRGFPEKDEGHVGREGGGGWMGEGGSYRASIGRRAIGQLHQNAAFRPSRIARAKKAKLLFSQLF